jgi:uncharacterized protein (TIGR02996 family)
MGYEMTGEGLLQAIIENPSDDAARLVYADWLDEHGQPERAEFIRTQIELNGLPMSDHRRSVLEDREADLLAVHEEEWLGTIPSHLPAWQFERGFVESVSLQYSKTLAGFTGLFAHHPIDSAKIWMGGPDDGSARWVDSPWLERLRILTASGIVRTDEFRTLLTSPRLRGLTGLNSNVFRAGENYPGVHSANNYLDDILCRPWLPTLEFLGLAELTDACVNRILAKPNLNRLTDLRFGTSLLSEQAVNALTGPDHASRWKALTLHSPPAASLDRLASCDRLERLDVSWPFDASECLTLPASLTHLDFNCHSQGWISPIALANLACLSRLEFLRFWIRPVYTPPEDAGFCGLADLLAGLSGPVLHLNLVQNLLPLRDFLRLPHLDHVRSLTVDELKMTDDDVRSLTECTGLTNLRVLELNTAGLTAKHAGWLARSPILARLRKLGLGDNQLGAEGVSAILTAPHLRFLTNLDLAENVLGQKAVQVLLDWPGLRRLRHLDLSFNALDKKTTQALLADQRLSPLTTITLLEWMEGKRRLGAVGERFGCRLQSGFLD